MPKAKGKKVASAALNNAQPVLTRAAIKKQKAQTLNPSAPPGTKAKPFIPRYLGSPRWRDDLITYGGGKEVRAILTHRSTGGSKADPELPTVLKPLKEAAKMAFANGTGYFVSGHLLSNEFGGPGDVTKNLVPLTRTGNKRHSDIENLVKEAQTCLHRVFETDHRGDFDYYVGIAYRVSVPDYTSAKDWHGTETPFCWVPKFLRITIGLVGYNWDDEEEQWVMKKNTAGDPDYYTGIEADAYAVALQKREKKWPGPGSPSGDNLLEILVSATDFVVDTEIPAADLQKLEAAHSG